MLDPSVDGFPRLRRCGCWRSCHFGTRWEARNRGNWCSSCSRWDPIPNIPTGSNWSVKDPGNIGNFNILQRQGDTMETILGHAGLPGVASRGSCKWSMKLAWILGVPFGDTRFRLATVLFCHTLFSISQGELKKMTRPSQEKLKYAEHRTLFMICVCLILFELLPSDFCDMFYCFMYFLFCFCARLGALSGYALWQYLSSDGAGRALRTFDGILCREAGSCLTKGCKGKTMESILFFHIDFCLSAYVGIVILMFVHLYMIRFKVYPFSLNACLCTTWMCGFPFLPCAFQVEQRVMDLCGGEASLSLRLAARACSDDEACWRKWRATAMFALRIARFYSALVLSKRLKHSETRMVVWSIYAEFARRKEFLPPWEHVRWGLACLNRPSVLACLLTLERSMQQNGRVFLGMTAWCPRPGPPCFQEVWSCVKLFSET